MKITKGNKIPFPILIGYPIRSKFIFHSSYSLSPPTKRKSCSENDYNLICLTSAYTSSNHQGEIILTITFLLQKIPVESHRSIHGRIHKVSLLIYDEVEISAALEFGSIGQWLHVAELTSQPLAESVWGNIRRATCPPYVTNMNPTHPPNQKRRRQDRTLT